MTKDIVLRLSCDLEQTKFEFEGCKTEEEVMDLFVYALDDINQNTGNGLKVIEAKTVESGQDADMAKKFLDFLQSKSDDYQYDLKRYGKAAPIMTNRYREMLAYKTMTESILGLSVSIDINGIVSIDGKIGKENKYDDIFVRVNDLLIHIAPGDGTNDDSLEEGCVDYIYYEVFDLDGNEVDGGQLDIEKEFEDEYESTSDCIKDILPMVFDTMSNTVAEILADAKIFDHCECFENLPEGWNNQ